MALNLHPVPGKAKSKMICEAFAAGAPRDAQGHVFYGVTEGNRDAWRYARRSVGFGGAYYFIDNSYFDAVRGQQFRVTKNRVQHSGFGISDCKRFDALGIEVQRMRDPNRGRVLAVQQSPLFMRLVAHQPNWLTNMIERELALDFRSVRCRQWESNKLKAQGTLQDDLRNADMVLTHSSAAAVEAVLAGLQAKVSNMSAAQPIALGELTDRRQWAGVLADNQFTLDEMKEGLAWATLARN
jgi:hypothetical protein